MAELRIGTAERESAAAALNTHLDEGRLNVEEFADRSAKASVATTAAELGALFTDLPAPHPALPGEPGSAPAVRPAPAAPAPAVERRPMAGVGSRIAAASPIIATILFFVLQFGLHVPFAWMAFLLIPLVGALGFSREQSQHRERRER